MKADETNAAQLLAERCAEAMWNGDEASRKLGMKIISVGEGCSIVTMPVRKDMLNGHQTIHGGIIFTLADSAFAFACNSRNSTSYAMSCGIDFIRPAFLGDMLTARAEEQSLTRSSGYYEVAVTNQDNKIVAHFHGRSHTRGEPLIEHQDQK
ncbi:MAG TPA: hydroxyphenylacetyl-CoA thioesterase PaaI [Xanthomonadales bacterium]|nr:hydroxyphenylacetyl-CoA thioesterase PaaI [Xanthomonadales bacterium]